MRLHQYIALMILTMLTIRAPINSFLSHKRRLLECTSAGVPFGTFEEETLALPSEVAQSGNRGFDSRGQIAVVRSIGAFWLEEIEPALIKGVQSGLNSALKTINDRVYYALREFSSSLALNSRVSHGAPGTHQIEELKRGRLGWERAMELLGLQIDPNVAPMTKEGVTFLFVRDGANARGATYWSRMLSQPHGGAPLALLFGMHVLIPARPFEILTEEQRAFVLEHERLEAVSRSPSQTGQRSHAEAVRQQGVRDYNAMVGSIRRTLIEAADETTEAHEMSAPLSRSPEQIKLEQIRWAREFQKISGENVDLIDLLRSAPGMLLSNPLINISWQRWSSKRVIVLARFYNADMKPLGYIVFSPMLNGNYILLQSRRHIEDNVLAPWPIELSSFMASLREWSKESGTLLIEQERQFDPFTLNQLQAFMGTWDYEEAMQTTSQLEAFHISLVAHPTVNARFQEQVLRELGFKDLFMLSSLYRYWRSAEKRGLAVRTAYFENRRDEAPLIAFKKLLENPHLPIEMQQPSLLAAVLYKLGVKETNYFNVYYALLRETELAHLDIVRIYEEFRNKPEERAQYLKRLLANIPGGSEFKLLSVGANTFRGFIHFLRNREDHYKPPTHPLHLFEAVDQADGPIESHAIGLAIGRSGRSLTEGLRFLISCGFIEKEGNASHASYIKSRQIIGHESIIKELLSTISHSRPDKFEATNLRHLWEERMGISA